MLSVDLLSYRIIHTYKISLDTGRVDNISFAIAVEVLIIL